MSKVILLTGATDGIGLLTAQKLVALGHHVLIHGRNTEKLATVEKTLTALNAGKVTSYQADLSDVTEAKSLAREIRRQHSHLDIMINNAGVYKTNEPITKDKLDVRFVVNTISPYVLTKRLLPIMDNTGRVINLSSAAQASVNLKAVTGEQIIDDAFTAYAQSKLAITMWSRSLAQSVGDQGSAIIAVNPGSLLASKMVTEGFGVAGNDLNIGADILIRLSLSDEFKQASGLYFDNDVGRLSPPHTDGLNDQKCMALIKVLDDLESRFTIE